MDGYYLIQNILYFKVLNCRLEMTVIFVVVYWYLCPHLEFLFKFANWGVSSLMVWKVAVLKVQRGCDSSPENWESWQVGRIHNVELLRKLVVMFCFPRVQIANGKQELRSDAITIEGMLGKSTNWIHTEKRCKQCRYCSFRGRRHSDLSGKKQDTRELFYRKYDSGWWNTPAKKIIGS